MELDVGAIACIYKGEFRSSPVLQIIDIRKISPAFDNTKHLDRYRLSLSDGRHSHYALLSVRWNHLVEEKLIRVFAVIRLIGYVTNAIQNNKRLILVDDVQILGIGDDIIGRPVCLESNNNIGSNSFSDLSKSLPLSDPRLLRRNSVPAPTVDRPRQDSDDCQCLQCSCGHVKSQQTEINTLKEQVEHIRGQQEEIDMLYGEMDKLKGRNLGTLSNKDLQNLLVTVISAHAAILSEQHNRKEKLCHICLEQDRAIALVPCGHCSLCEECASKISDSCPDCRTPIKDKIRVYL
mmetsp:Transcript_28688/g.46476  ORF Transcript_28688/g.46476 Transcript_28688/m.46476 type:complete len:292 (-) Transcript_28688:55-930(-)